MEPPARAADRAGIQALFLYRGCGRPWWPVPCTRLMRGHAGMGVSAGCGTRGFAARRGCGPVGPGDAGERLAVAGHGLVWVSGTGCQVREVARSGSP